MGKTSKKQRRSLLYALIALAVVLAAVVEWTVGWGTLLTGTGLQPASTTVEGTMEVHFIDVGNADCILVRQGEHTLLVDAGERGDSDTILKYLRANGVKRLDMVVATHPHADHIGSMAMVVAAFPIDRFVMSFMPDGATPTTMTYLHLLEALDSNGVTVDEAVPGTTYTLGEAQLQVLAPYESTDEANDISVVTRLQFGERAFLFTGDAGKTVEQQMINGDYPLTADVLKVSHHGSTTGNSAAFLKAVSPRYAVIPCGAGNSYGHPHKEVLARLEKQGVTTYRADVSGTVVFATDGINLSVKAARE